MEAGVRATTLPAVADVRQALGRLVREEEEGRRALARLEARLRHFEDVERPAYESWVRLALGPAVARLDEATAALRAKALLADRVDELVAVYRMQPREALHAARTGKLDEEREAVAARRQAKRDRKRAERKQERRARRATPAGPAAGADGAGAPPVVTLYRRLARRLHPDSPTAVRGLPPGRLGAVWSEVQAAYAARNRDRLLALSTWLDTEASADETGSADAPILSIAERHARLRAMRTASRALERRLTALAGDPAWGFPDTAADERRRLERAAAARLASDLEDVARELGELDDWLAAIGTPRPPRGRARRR